MKIFSISRPAIFAIIEGFFAECNRILEKPAWSALNNISWTDELEVGSGGLDIHTEDLPIYLDSISEFFGMPETAFENASVANKVGDWVSIIKAHCDQQMLQFHFRPAGSKVLCGEEIKNSKNDDVPIQVCSHRVSALYQEASAVANLLQGRRRLITMVSPHSLLGLVVGTLMPALQKIEIVDARHLSPDELTQTLNYGDVLVATPSLWAYLIRENIHGPDNIMAVSFGEMMSADLAVKLRRNGFGVMRELYGSTQTGLVAWRDTPNDDFILFDHWSRKGDDLIRYFPDGVEKSIVPMDFFDWKTSRSFSLSGRRDGAVQIGAVNVFPSKIEAIICQLEQIDNCSIRVVKTDLGTNRLIADVFLLEKIVPDEKMARIIDGWCRSQLAIHERPHILNFYTS